MSPKENNPDEVIVMPVISKLGWHHTPAPPVALTPLFDWPPSPKKIIQWISGIWLRASIRSAILALSILTWLFLQPDTSRVVTFKFDWIAEMYLRNLALMTVVAGGLHLWLYCYKKQGADQQFDTRDLSRISARFTFGKQVYDNIFWTLASGVTIWTAFEVVTMWGYANGYVPYLAFNDNPAWFVLLFLLQPLWGGFHFYWIHRALHWPLLYRLAHSLHHRNINVGPWSGMSMHPIEHIMYLSGVLIHWVIASHPIHFLFHMQVKTLEAVTSHAGHQKLVVSKGTEYELGDFFHQLHHRYFECNYGTIEMPLDRWFGTFHSGTVADSKKIKMRKHREHKET
jgi:sterol desaturase/sphingolipid hydroxylase (fatty acid hydroxylase superfamily)